MRGTISFHPVDPAFFETLVEPLLRGDKVNPEIFLESARRTRRAAWLTLGYKAALARLLEEVEPPPPVDVGTLWDRVRTRLERFDYKVPPLARAAHATIDPDLHLGGRPFLVTEAAPDRVAEIVAEYAASLRDDDVTAIVVDQLGRLNKQLAEEVEPQWVDEPSRDANYRTELLDGLKQIRTWGQSPRDTSSGGPIAARARARAASELAAQLPWHILWLHSRAVPFWVARDVDGLGTICEAAGLAPPAGLGRASELYAGVCAELPDLPELRERLRADLSGPRDLGAYVAPAEVPGLLAFLVEHGGRMIQVATRHGQGPLCTRVLRKIRECLRFAERHGVGYLEASGIHPPLEDPAERPGVLDEVPVGER